MVIIIIIIIIVHDNVLAEIGKCISIVTYRLHL